MKRNFTTSRFWRMPGRGVNGLRPNCPRCGWWLCADRTCRCGWPKAKARRQRTCVLIGPAASSAASGKSCAAPGCFNPYLAARELCWSHYRKKLKQVARNPGRGLGCYRGLPRKLIREIASMRKARIYGTKARLFRARVLIFDTAGGRIMNLPRKQRLFVNRVSHESYDRYLVRCWERNTAPKSFRAFRRRWYGAQKLNWQRFDVPRMMSLRS